MPSRRWVALNQLDFGGRRVLSDGRASTMKHRVFTICSALSLVLCLAILVLWHRSRSQYDTLGHWTSSGGLPGGSDHQLISTNSGLIYRRAWNRGTFVSLALPTPRAFFNSLG